MKAYRQDPLTYRHHFHNQVGGDLPGFKGARIQYGNGIGSFLGALARKAIPLIKAGVRMAAPHAKKAAKNIAKELGGKVIQKFPVGLRIKLLVNQRKQSESERG